MLLFYAFYASCACAACVGSYLISSSFCGFHQPANAKNAKGRYSKRAKP